MVNRENPGVNCINPTPWQPMSSTIDGELKKRLSNGLDYAHEHEPESAKAMRAITSSERSQSIKSVHSSIQLEVSTDGVSQKNQGAEGMLGDDVSPELRDDSRTGTNSFKSTYDSPQGQISHTPSSMSPQDRVDGSVPTQIMDFSNHDMDDLEAAFSQAGVDRQSIFTDIYAETDSNDDDIVGVGCFDTVDHILCASSIDEKLDIDLDLLAEQCYIADGYRPGRSMVLWISVQQPRSENVLPIRYECQPSAGIWSNVSAWLLGILSSTRVQNIFFGTRLYMSLLTLNSPRFSVEELSTSALTEQVESHWYKDNIAVSLVVDHFYQQKSLHKTVSTKPRTDWRKEKHTKLPQGRRGQSTGGTPNNTSISLLRGTTSPTAGSFSAEPGQDASFTLVNSQPGTWRQELSVSVRESEPQPILGRTLAQPLLCHFCDCPGEFLNDAELANHIAVMHRFRCRVWKCARGFHNEAELSNHIEVKHQGEEDKATATREARRSGELVRPRKLQLNGSATENHFCVRFGQAAKTFFVERRVFSVLMYERCGLVRGQTTSDILSNPEPPVYRFSAPNGDAVAAFVCHYVIVHERISYFLAIPLRTYKTRSNADEDRYERDKSLNLKLSQQTKSIAQTQLVPYSAKASITIELLPDSPWIENSYLQVDKPQSINWTAKARGLGMVKNNEGWQYLVSSFKTGIDRGGECLELPVNFVQQEQPADHDSDFKRLRSRSLPSTPWN